LRFKRLSILFAAVAITYFLSFELQAQTASPLSGKKPATPPIEAAVNDTLGRTTPQGTIIGFMLSAQKGDDDRALKYLDTKRSGRSGHRLVNELQVVLERGFSGKLGMLSTKAQGRLDDNLPTTKELVGSIKSESGSLDVLLERTQRGNDPPVWLFASETLAKVPEFYEDLNGHSFDKYFPRFMTDTWFLWFPLWQWIYILFIIPLSFIVATLLTRLLTPLLIAVVFRITRVRADHHVMTLTGPIRIFILAFSMWTVSIITRSVLVNLFWTYASLTLAIVGTTWLAVRLIDIVVRLKHKQWANTPSGRIAMIQLVGKLSKALAVIAGALVILYIAGVNITAALTGLGIGGIAVAFAAQKTLENLFGGIMIISDQPIRVGDFCKAGNYSGTVESIGLRSTYLRTPDRTIVSIPNGQLAVMSLENFAMRDKILLQHKIGLHPETTSRQLARILEEIGEALRHHPKVETSTARVNFVRISDAALMLELNAYVMETTYEVFVVIQEELLINAMNIIETAGTRIAAPLQNGQVPRGAEDQKP
jgi:MscS family membrane protein